MTSQLACARRSQLRAHTRPQPSCGLLTISDAHKAKLAHRGHAADEVEDGARFRTLRGSPQCRVTDTQQHGSMRRGLTTSNASASGMTPEKRLTSDCGCHRRASDASMKLSVAE